MTVNTSANKLVAAGNGVQTSFAFSFIAVDPSDISVIYTDASGNQTALQPSQYTIALNPATPGSLWAIGGTVTYPLVGSPIAVGTSLTILRTLSLTQLVSLSNQGNQFPSAIEQAIDLLEMQLQQTNELFQRALVAPVVDASAPLPLPAAAQRANQALLFDANGNPIAGGVPATGVISTAMQPVVDAATLALGRAAFGLGTAATHNIGAGLQDDGNGGIRVNQPLTQVSTNQVVTAAFAQNGYIATGPINFTLARANTLWNGFAFFIIAQVAAVALIPDSHDTIQPAASGTTVSIPAGCIAIITTDAASAGNWWIELIPTVGLIPQGYLSLQSGQRVPLSDQNNKTQVFYMPDTGGLVPLNIGGSMTPVPFGQLTLTLPGTLASGACYDLYIALSAGLPTLMIGPRWRNSGQAITGASGTPIVITANGHGLVNGDSVYVDNVVGNTAANGVWTVASAGANNFTLTGSASNGSFIANTGRFASRGAPLELAKQNGIWTNALPITCQNGLSNFSLGAAAGTAVGTLLTDASGPTVSCDVTYQQGATWGLFNFYNRKKVRLKGGDFSTSWSYQSNIVRNSNSNPNNSLIAVCGLPEEKALARLVQRLDIILSGSQTGENLCGVGWQTNNQFCGRVGAFALTMPAGGGGQADGVGEYLSAPFLGAVTVNALEQCPVNSANNVFVGQETAMVLSLDFNA